MFDGFKSLWKGIVKMFNYTTIKSVVGRDIALSQSMIEAINEWNNMLNGNAPWCSDVIESLGIEGGICREFADAVLVELEIKVLNNDKLDEAFRKCVLANLNENMQEGIGLGSFIIKPLGPDKAEFVSADKFIPIRFSDDGKPIDIAFLNVKKVGNYNYYTKVERHYFVDGNLTIENKCYHSQSATSIGSECNLDSVDEWETINPGPITYIGMNNMDFGYYRNPIKNKIDGSYCGVSVFESSEAKTAIKKADMQCARLDWEYESGERAIHVDDRALKKKGGKTYLPHLRSKLYRGLNLEDGKDKELYKEYSPQMRDEAYLRGLEEYKREIEFNVGLAYGDLSNVQVVEKTAEEIRVSKNRKYNRVTAMQGKLEECFKDFLVGLAFYNGAYTAGYELSCKFNDSILTDEKAEREQDMKDVAAGFMHHWEYRMKWYGEDEETAKANVPEQNRVME